MLSSALGSIVTMPMAGAILSQVSKPVFVRWTAIMAVLGMCGVAGFSLTHSYPAAVASMFLMGMGIGPWDVAMNLAGTDVEHALGRSLMPQFHAGFSLGTVTAALAGAVLSKLGLSLAVHLVGAGVVILLLIWWGCANLLGEPDRAPSSTRSTSPKCGRVRAALSAWFELRTVLIGVVVLAAGLTEGSANDWLALGIDQDFEVAESIGILGLALFLTAMTSMRVLGTRLVDLYGRVVVQRLCAGLAVAGLLSFTLGQNLIWVMVGALVWGLGSGMGFPLGLSAAADNPERAAARASVVSTIGYTAFLGGPAFMGWLAGHVGYRHALLAILLPAIAALFLAPVLRPKPPATQSS